MDLRGSERVPSRVPGCPLGFLGVLKGSWGSSRKPGGPQGIGGLKRDQVGVRWCQRFYGVVKLF